MTTHPSVAAYNKGCRCADCKAAVAAYKVEYRERKASEVFTRRNAAGTNVPIPHGTTTGYNHHKCRCQPCRDARAQYQRDRRESQPVRVHQSRPSSVPIEPLWARIESASGARIEEVRVDGHMPEHRHGMNYKASVKVQAEPGRYRAEGLMFHMPGKWEFLFDLRDAKGMERLKQEFLLK
jgi:hypothetical protein